MSTAKKKEQWHTGEDGKQEPENLQEAGNELDLIRAQELDLARGKPIVVEKEGDVVEVGVPKNSCGNRRQRHADDCADIQPAAQGDVIQQEDTQSRATSTTGLPCDERTRCAQKHALGSAPARKQGLCGAAVEGARVTT